MKIFEKLTGLQQVGDLQEEEILFADDLVIFA